LPNCSYEFNHGNVLATSALGLTLQLFGKKFNSIGNGGGCESGACRCNHTVALHANVGTREERINPNLLCIFFDLFKKIIFVVLRVHCDIYQSFYNIS
jgi:hypothetical protein